MPLTAVNFVNKGPVLHADLLQFFSLFTGSMADQPVTFKNTLSVGGSQANTTVPVKLYGATGQTSHLIDLYTDPSQANPGWGIAASGQMGWGPGGAAPIDTFLSRVATQNGHSSDTAGLLVSPYLEVAGNISATTYLFPNGATLSGPTANPLQLVVNQDLLVNRNVIVGTSTTPPVIHPLTSSNSSNLVVEAPNGVVQAAGKAYVSMSGNAYNTTGGWGVYDTTQPAALLLLQGAMYLYLQPAGMASPITNWGAPYIQALAGGAVTMASGALQVYGGQYGSVNQPSAIVAWDATNGARFMGYNPGGPSWNNVILQGLNVSLVPQGGVVIPNLQVQTFTGNRITNVPASTNQLIISVTFPAPTGLFLVWAQVMYLNHGPSNDNFVFSLTNIGGGAWFNQMYMTGLPNLWGSGSLAPVILNSASYSGVELRLVGNSMSLDLGGDFSRVVIMRYA